MAERLAWGPRFPPLAPGAVAAVGRTGGLEGALATALGAGARLAVDRADGVLVVRALDQTPLPWAEGVRFFGRCPDHPRLWLPTARRPLAPMALLWQLLAAELPDASDLLLWPDAPGHRFVLGPPWPVP